MTQRLDTTRVGTMRVVGTGAAIAGVVGVLLLLGWGLIHTNAAQPDAGLAPAFGLTSFDGDALTLEGLRGKVVVVNFWASWCVPCRTEADHLERMSRKYAGEVVFVGVDYADTNKAARAFIEEFGLTYFNGPDLGTRISTRYRIKGVPETFYIGRDGRLRGMKEGPVSAIELETKIIGLLGDPDA